MTDPEYQLIARKLEQLIKYSEILGYYQAKRYDIEKIINDIYTLKTELLEIILKNKNHDHRQD